MYIPVILDRKKHFPPLSMSQPEFQGTRNNVLFGTF